MGLSYLAMLLPNSYANLRREIRKARTGEGETTMRTSTPIDVRMSSERKGNREADWKTMKRVAVIFIYIRVCVCVLGEDRGRHVKCDVMTQLICINDTQHGFQSQAI